MPPRGEAVAKARPARRSPGPGRPLISPAFLAEHRRRRIIEAFAELCAEKGYAGTSISDLAKRAAVARKTIYDNFEGKEAIFLAAFDMALADVVERVQVSCAEAEGDWRQRVEAGLAALLGYIAEQPALAHLCMVEAISAMPAANRRYEEALRAFVEMVGAAPKEEPLPGTIDESLVGGVAWILYQQIRGGGAERAEDLLPDLTKFMLAPYRSSSS